MALKPIEILIEAKPMGEDAVEKLAKTLDGLGSTLQGDVSAGAKSAAASLRTLSQGNEAAQNFAVLKREAVDLRTVLDKSSATVDAVSRQMSEAAAATGKFSTAEDEAKKSVESARRDLEAMQATLKALKSGNESAARGTDDYKASVSQARSAIAELSKSLAQKRDDLRQAQTSTTAAKEAEKELEGEYIKSIDVAKKASVAYGEKVRGLDAARTAARALGVDTTNLRQAEQALANGMEEAKSKVQSLLAVQEAAAKSATAAAAEQKRLAAATKAAADEMRESDRLLVIQKKAAEEQAAKGRNALLAEIAAQHEAEAQVRKTAAANIAAVRGIIPAYQGAAASAEQSSARQATSNQRASDSVKNISEQLDSLKIQMLGLVGVGVGTQGIKDLAALADGYKNLEAKIKLVTGEGKAFDTAFQGVFDIAKRTNSAVEETGVLFTKLYEAGKPLGLLQQDALKLTETINQSIQLSGASAEASGAAIQQLIQGLQSGVLRGDEFNSVMEQAPRLAKALADGLGVTTGELRKMAEEGRLTSSTVISSLQKQSDAIASEFGKLPATVGRAMTNLTTEFTRYVGEADKAGGYTSKLAGVIDTLAGNLSTVASVMIHTGQALGAMKLLTMAQEWMSASAAIKATSVAAEAATVQLGTAGKAAAAAQVELTGFGAALKLIKGFALLDIALNFKSYGTAIGEAAAKLMGYKDRTEELTRSEKLAAEMVQTNIKFRRDQALALKEATDRSFDLGKAGAKLVADFDEMRTKGDSAADAIGKIGKDFDLSSVPGIKNAIVVLDRLKTDGKLTAAEFQKAWSDALSGQDLAVFEVKAKAAFLNVQLEAEKAADKVQAAIAKGLNGKELDDLKKKAEAAFSATTRESEKLAQMLDASLRESIRRTGLDFEGLRGGISKMAQSAVNDTQIIIDGLDRLKAQGVDTGRALTASISKGIDTADAQKALDLVKQQIESVRAKLGEAVTNGLLDQAKQKSLELSDALDKAKPGINSVREAMAELGMKSREELVQTAKKAEEAYGVMKAAGMAEGESYEAWQKRKSAAAEVMLGRMLEANSGVASAVIKTRAAMEGLEIQTDSTGKSIVVAMGKGSDAAKGLGDAVKLTTEQIQAQEDAADRLAMRYKLSADYTERQIGLLERENALVERRNALERERLNIDKEGYSLNTAGQRVNAQGESQASIYERAKSAGLTEEQALKLSNETALPYSGPSVKVASPLDNGSNWSTDLQKKIDQLVLSNASANAGSNAPAPAAPAATPAPAAATPAAPTYVTYITIPPAGQKKISTTDASSSANVNDLLRQLAEARGTAS